MKTITVSIKEYPNKMLIATSEDMPNLIVVSEKGEADLMRKIPKVINLLRRAESNKKTIRKLPLINSAQYALPA